MNNLLPYNLSPVIPSGREMDLRGAPVLEYYRRKLFFRLLSVLKFDLPPAWDEDYVKEILFAHGYIIVTDTKTFGVIPQYGTLSGYNLYLQPDTVLISNPHFTQPLERKIGKNCVLVKLTPDYQGLMDMVNEYAEQLALCAISLSVNLVNTRTTTVFDVSSKADAEKVKKAYDQVIEGKPFVVEHGSSFTPSWFNANAKSNYISLDLLQTMREIENQFATDVGLPNSNTMKKERLTVDEVNANNVETQTVMDMLLDSLKKGFSEVNTKYGNWIGSPLSVDWRVKNVKGSTDSVRSV